MRHEHGVRVGDFYFFEWLENKIEETKVDILSCMDRLFEDQTTHRRKDFYVHYKKLAKECRWGAAPNDGLGNILEFCAHFLWFDMKGGTHR